MSNAYGFDFLRTEHLDESAQQDVNGVRKSIKDDEPGAPQALSEEELLANQNKPDLEQQFEVLTFLRKHRGSGFLAPSVIYKSTGIDLDVKVKVGEMLRKNPKVKVELLPDPYDPATKVAAYAYQAKFSMVRDRTSLLAQINRMVSGVPMRDLEDSYQGVGSDLAALITAGDVVAVSNSEDRDKIIFPRGEAFLVELDGIVSVNQPQGGKKEIVLLETDVDPTSQIRRGEAIQVGGQWFRLSSMVKEGVSLAEQPARAQAPLSVVSLPDRPKRNEIDGYTRPFDARTLPIDAPLSAVAIENLRKAKDAREQLVKMAHGARISSGGGGGSLGVLVGQTLGSLAHSGNPTALAGAAASSTGPALASSSGRRRQNRNAPSGPNANIGGVSKEDLIQAASDPYLATFSHACRHGCTKDIRQMYLETTSLVPESDADLQAKLVEQKLLEPGEQMRRDRLKRSTAGNLDNDGKKKKKRYYERKNQRMTNTFLDGTPEGAALALALEQQKQGKSVGDGGM